MTDAAKKVLDDFQSLSDQERSQVIVELVRLIPVFSHDLPDDSDLTAAADQVFLKFDRREHAE